MADSNESKPFGWLLSRATLADSFCLAAGLEDTGTSRNDSSESDDASGRTDVAGTGLTTCNFSQKMTWMLLDGAENISVVKLAYWDRRSSYTIHFAAIYKEES